MFDTIKNWTWQYWLAVFVVLVIIVLLILWVKRDSKSGYLPGVSYIDRMGVGLPPVNDLVHQAIGYKSNDGSRVRLSTDQENIKGYESRAHRREDAMKALLDSDQRQLIALNGGYTDYMSQSDVADMERQVLFPAGSQVTQFNTENIYDVSMDANSPTYSPDIDYNAVVVGLAADPTTYRNHRNWVSEHQYFSGAHRAIDNLDEALEASTNFSVFRPSPVAQRSDAPFITESDANILISNDKYRVHQQAKTHL